MTSCSVDGCSRKHLAKGMCALHYGRAKLKRVPAKCKNCGGDFMAIKSGKRLGTYCSLTCRSAFNAVAARRPKTAAEVNCRQCGNGFIATPSQISRGRKFCSQDCCLKFKKQEFAKERDNRRCLKCQKGPVAAQGMCHACYQRWSNSIGPGSKRFHLECEHCRTEFYSHSKKVFCSLDCYLKSDRFQKIQSARVEKVMAARVSHACLNCQCEMSLKPCLAGKRKFCCKRCMREYYADRFDRWVANPQAIEMPSSFDEFMMLDELPCLVSGCNWVGRNLSTHVNQVHGIACDEFKKMAGFSKGTGLVVLETSEAMSQIAIARNAIGPAKHNPPKMDRKATRGPGSLESKEHRKKTIATICELRGPLSCLECGNSFASTNVTHTKFCSKLCRHRAGERKRQRHRKAATSQ